jgi:hypothetical protein
MKLLTANIQWVRVIVTSLLVIVLSFLVVTIITFYHIFVLAFEAHGKPDQAVISHYASTISRWMMPILELFFTFILALISTKKTENYSSIHGLLIGIFAGVLCIIVKMSFGGHLNYHTYIFFIIVIGLGFIGGYFRQMLFTKKMKSLA